MNNHEDYNSIRIREKMLRLGAYFQEQREIRDLTQKQVAKLAGLAQLTVGRIERGRKSTGPSRMALRAALDAIPIPPGVSLLWEDDPATETASAPAEPAVDP